jgi:hypothetical protein
VPLRLRVGLRIDLGEEDGGVDVAVLVGDPQIADDVGPIARQRVEDRLEVLRERHRADPKPNAPDRRELLAVAFGALTRFFRS